MKIVLKRILVPTDFSEHARAAVIYGLALVEEFQASLHVLHVVDEIPGVDPVLPLPARKKVERKIESRAWEELRTLLPEEESNRVRTFLALEWGTPAVEIIRYAKGHAIDLIALGTHGRGLQHVLMGSVTESVVREAPCPVLTLHHPEREFVLPA